MLSEIGPDGQLKLKQAKILIIGIGGLGSPAALYLAAAGIGELTLVDDDSVELTNLQRQILFKVNHLGQDKVKAAQKNLTSLNKEIKIKPITARLSADNANALIQHADLVLDCSDNFTTRYLVNEICHLESKVLISGAAVGTQGQLMVFDNRQPDLGCYQCIFPPSQMQTSLNCQTAGVYGPLLGVIGSMQALHAMNIILGHTEGNQFISFDGLTLKQINIQLSKNSDCEIC